MKIEQESEDFPEPTEALKDVYRAYLKSEALKIRKQVWCNVYSNGYVRIHYTEESAKSWIGEEPKRIAVSCVLTESRHII